MNKSTIKVMIDNIASPAFVADDRGNILLKNWHMRYIREKLNSPEFLHTSKMNLTYDEKLDDYSRRFHITNTDIVGFVYYVDTTDEGGVKERLSVYIFDNMIVKSNLIENVIEHIDEVVVIFNQYGVLERMNSICDKILPFKRKDVLGKNISELVDMGLVTEPIIKGLIKSKDKIYKDIVYPNGKIISYTAIPIFGVNGNFKGGVLTGRDISRLINMAKTVEHNDDTDIEYISVNHEIKEIKKIIERVAPSDAAVFIMGESGVGKEILTRSIWKQSNRRNKPLVEVNCAAIPSELIESELFGYEKGAFTGANEEGKVGLIESADGGTIFLDEIGEMPLEIQTKLLRVLQEKCVQRIGGLTPKKVDVRFISATNKTAEEIANPEIFRQDLYYRLSVIPITVPPLRERKEDIKPISEFYLNLFNKKYNRKLEFNEEAFDVLHVYKWPGNIRELKNIIERVVILSPFEIVSGDQIGCAIGLGIENILENVNEKSSNFVEPKKNDYNNEKESIIDISQVSNIEEAHLMVEELMLKKAIAKYGNITKAAQSVGVNPSTVYRKIKNGKLNL